MKSRILGLLAATALTMAGASVASAADLPLRAAPPAPVIAAAPVFTWTGFYVGANAGYHFSGDNDFDRTAATGFGAGVLANTIPLGFESDRDGFIGGVQAGYNFQFGSVVFGVEADIQYTDVESDTTIFSNPGGLFFPSTSTATSELDYLGTVRARLGFAFDRALVYATGGLAYGDVTNAVAVTFTPVGAAPFTYAGSESDVEFGWTIGAGVEYAFTNNLTFKAEYLYYNLGDNTIVATGPNPANTVSYKVENDGHIARAGINFKFNTF